MKADIIEIHFLAGQLFTLGVAFLAIGPRMPFDSRNSIGGKLSYPFRRALLGLVILGMIRILICHILFSRNTSPKVQVLDEVFSTIEIVGQSFLCLTTAYILERQLSTIINIRPGESLMQILAIVTFLTPLGVILAHSTGNTRYHAFGHIAQAISCYGVLNTIQIYSSVMSPPQSSSSSSDSSSSSHNNNNGPFMTQLVKLTEYWFLFSSLLSVVGEMIILVVDSPTKDYPAIAILIKSIEYNQDSGIDVWTRLLIHSIFLNYLDEIQHYTTPSSSTTSTGDGTGTTNGGHNHNNNNNNYKPQPYSDAADDVGATNSNELTTITTVAPSLRSRHIL